MKVYIVKSVDWAWPRDHDWILKGFYSYEKACRYAMHIDARSFIVNRCDHDCYMITSDEFDSGNNCRDVWAAMTKEDFENDDKMLISFYIEEVEIES